MDKKIIVGSLLLVLSVVIFSLVSTRDTAKSVSVEENISLPIQDEQSTDTQNSGSAKIDIRFACQSALAYTDFIDGASADAFIEDCINGEHPEVIERYIESLELEDDMAI